MFKNKKQKIIIIVGPTASGKSDLAVRLAKKIDGEIISADSRQVYKGLDIGTGKITKKEMKGVEHHLLDVADPKKQFTVSDFLRISNETIVKIDMRGKVPIVCGGTGFYIDALLGERQIPEVLPNPKLRKQLGNKNTEELFEMLKKLDPERAKNIDRQNPRRLIRAIEICKALGSVPKIKDDTKNEISNKFKIIKVGIEIPNEELKNRIKTRLNKRLKLGMVNEAKNLHAKGLSYKRMRSLGLEYKYLADFLEEKITKEQMVEILNAKIWQYAKRQKLWFKKDKSIKWLKPGTHTDFLNAALKYFRVEEK